MNLMAQGSPDAAREMLQKGISSVQQHLGTATHPLLAVMNNQAAVVYLIGSMLEDAESAARESLRIISCLSAPTSVEVAACQLRLATVLAAQQQVGEAKRLLGSATPILGASPPHQDSYGEALYYTGLCALQGATSYGAVRRVDDLMLEGLRKFGEKIDLQRPLIDVALREHGLLRARAEERGEWEAVEGMLQQALLLVKQVGVELQLRGMLALQLGVVQYRHRDKEQEARETFTAALEALGDEVDESHDAIEQGLKRYEVLTEVLRRYGVAPPPQ